MRYQVPQYVDIEDKIIGPFTLKQFLIYLVAVLILIPIFLASDLALFLTIAIPSLGIAALFAHFSLNGKSLFSIIVSALNFSSRGQKFIWRRSHSTKPLVIKGEEYGNFAAIQDQNWSSLADRARSLETSGKVVDQDSEDPMLTDKAIEEK